MPRRAGSANGSVSRVAQVVPSKQEADAISAQVSALLVAEQRLQAVIDSDVNVLGTYDSPFVHPLYAMIIKIGTVRGKAARKLASYARFEKKQARDARQAAAASA